MSNYKQEIIIHLSLNEISTLEVARDLYRKTTRHYRSLDNFIRLLAMKGAGDILNDVVLSQFLDKDAKAITKRFYGATAISRTINEKKIASFNLELRKYCKINVGKVIQKLVEESIAKLN